MLSVALSSSNGHSNCGLPCQMGTVLMPPPVVGGNGHTRVLLKIRNLGMQGQEFLRPAGILAADLATFLLPGGPMGLLDQGVAADGRDDLDVLHSVEHGKFPNGTAPSLQRLSVGMTSGTSSFTRRRSRKVFAAWVSRRASNRRSSPAPESSTARQNQCVWPLISMQTSSRNHQEQGRVPSGATSR